MPVSDQAFVTLATNDAYCQGALVLGQSLRDQKATRMLVVLITPQVSRRLRALLSRVFDEVVEVNLTDSADHVRLAFLKRPELGVTLTKLHCWTLTRYSKCVFLDADTLVLCNIDELFERSELSAAPDPGWPDCFNSGVFVFRPSLRTHGLLLRHASDHGSFDGADQGLLNSFFSGWATADIAKHLPFTYNLSSNAAYTYTPAFRQFGSRAKVVHFLGPRKPWNYAYNPRAGSVAEEGPGAAAAAAAAADAPPPKHQLSFLNRWWDIYHRSVLPLYGRIPEGPRNIPEGPRNIPEGPRNVPEGPRNIPEGPQNISDEPRNIPEGRWNVPEGPWNIPDWPQNIPDQPRNIPEGPQNIPDEPRNIPEGRWNVPEGPRNVPEGPQDIPDEPQNILKGPQSILQGPRNVPEGQWNIPEGPQNILKGPQNIPEGPQNVPEGRWNVPEGPRNIPEGRWNVPEGPRNIPEGRWNVPERPQNIPEGPRNVPEGRRNVPDKPRRASPGPLTPGRPGTEPSAGARPERTPPPFPRGADLTETHTTPAPLTETVALAVSVSEIAIEEKARALSPEEQRRKWEEGHIDYMGTDAFARIQEKLDRFLQ